MKREEIRIRDPFIYADKKTKTYYMYGTINGGASDSKFYVYTSKDLEEFEGPFVIFDGKKENFWATKDYWAPEMHEYKGKYYLFASVKEDNESRATQIFVCDTLDGEFKPVSEKPATPKEWWCLDGTLCIENEKPYIVFCHEWVQCKNGEICAQELSSDLSTPIGKPFLLFTAKDNPHVHSVHGVNADDYVTDGPFLWKKDGKWKMIWSSFQNGKYAVFGATAESIRGKWEHTDNLVDFDGGHGMLFETFDGVRKFALHSPNVCPNERAQFIDWKDRF